MLLEYGIDLTKSEGAPVEMIKSNMSVGGPPSESNHVPNILIEHDQNNRSHSLASAGGGARVHHGSQSISPDM